MRLLRRPVIAPHRDLTRIIDTRDHDWQGSDVNGEFRVGRHPGSG